MDDQKTEGYASSLPRPEDYQLKWHKFLIYFSLWAGALLDLVNAYSYFTGSMYGENAKGVYSYYSGMKTLDIFMGILMLAMAAYCIYVRFQLANYKAGAPKKLEFLYIANAAVMLLYLLAVSGVTKISISDLASDAWTQIAGSIAFVFINRAYYNKRAALFVN